MKDKQTDRKTHPEQMGYRKALNLLDRCRDWSFPEYVHGRKFTAGGTRHQGWSAAAAVIAHRSLQGEAVLRGSDRAE